MSLADCIECVVRVGRQAGAEQSVTCNKQADSEHKAGGEIELVAFD